MSPPDLAVGRTVRRACGTTVRHATVRSVSEGEPRPADEPPRDPNREERLAHLWVLESLDRINRAAQAACDLEQMMRDVLDTTLDVFDCDRAQLLYPCDPRTPSWRATMCGRGRNGPAHC